MQVQDAYPIIVTDKLVECRDFYTGQLGFQIVSRRRGSSTWRRRAIGRTASPSW
jgi:hypothetical protein